ncbi:MAG: universal stress protein [Cryomorphaceae bacterium]|nr:universal stress protein [Flavobacteriales bacterium]
MKSILLALDVENFNEKLVSISLDLCRQYDAKLWIIHVAPFPSDYLGKKDGPEYIRLTVAEELEHEYSFLQSLSERISGEKVEAEALLTGGEIVATIIEQAAKLDVGMIITGVNRHGFIANALGGNTALEIIKRSKVPVMSIPLR